MLLLLQYQCRIYPNALPINTLIQAKSFLRRPYFIWLAIQVGNLKWPKEVNILSTDQEWSIELFEGGESGKQFSIVLLLVNKVGHKQIEKWIEKGNKTNSFPGLESIKGASSLSIVDVKLK